MHKKKFKILVVEHNADLLDAIVNSLLAYGYNAFGIESSKEALARIADDGYDLVIADIHMPEMSGLELLERIKKTISVDIPVILVTGEVKVSYLLNAIRLGASDFIKKPIDIKTLSRSINASIKKKIAKVKATRFLNDFKMHFRFNSSEFSGQDIASTVFEYILEFYNIPPATANVIQMCLDEILDNAFIHGTLNLTKKQRELEHLKYISLINKLTSEPDIQKMHIDLWVSILGKEKTVEIKVSDQGKGFNYNYYIDNKELVNNLESGGRGINFIKLLMDEISYSDNGSTITVKKKW